MCVYLKLFSSSYCITLLSSPKMDSKDSKEYYLFHLRQVMINNNNENERFPRTPYQKSLCANKSGQDHTQKQEISLCVL